MVNMVVGSHGSVSDIEMMSNVNTSSNANQVITRNESEQTKEHNPPQVRKISRFQVSHVKEEETSIKPANIVHASEVLLEKVSPDQQKQPQISHEMVTQNIMMSADKSPDKVETIVCLQF